MIGDLLLGLSVVALNRDAIRSLILGEMKWLFVFMLGIELLLGVDKFNWYDGAELPYIASFDVILCIYVNINL